MGEMDLKRQMTHQCRFENSSPKRFVLLARRNAFRNPLPKRGIAQQQNGHRPDNAPCGKSLPPATCDNDERSGRSQKHVEVGPAAEPSLAALQPISVRLMPSISNSLLGRYKLTYRCRMLSSDRFYSCKRHFSPQRTEFNSCEPVPSFRTPSLSMQAVPSPSKVFTWSTPAPSRISPQRWLRHGFVAVSWIPWTIPSSVFVLPIDELSSSAGTTVLWSGRSNITTHSDARRSVASWWSLSAGRGRWLWSGRGPRTPPTFFEPQRKSKWVVFL